jgi:hypothetical protein
MAGIITNEPAHCTCVTRRLPHRPLVQSAVIVASAAPNVDRDLFHRVIAISCAFQALESHRACRVERVRDGPTSLGPASQVERFGCPPH